MLLVPGTQMIEWGWNIENYWEQGWILQQVLNWIYFYLYLYTFSFINRFHFIDYLQRVIER